MLCVTGKRFVQHFLFSEHPLQAHGGYQRVIVSGLPVLLYSHVKWQKEDNPKGGCICCYHFLSRKRLGASCKGNQAPQFRVTIELRLVDEEMFKCDKE